MKQLLDDEADKKVSITLYFTRDSFCMGDDVLAPNIRKYVWQKHYSSNVAFLYLQEYLGPNLPGYHWRGYCNGERFVDIFCKHGGDLEYSNTIILAENWKERLEEFRSIYFEHCSLDKDTLKEEIEQYYTFERADEVYRYYRKG